LHNIGIWKLGQKIVDIHNDFFVAVKGKIQDRFLQAVNQLEFLEVVKAARYPAAILPEEPMPEMRLDFRDSARLPVACLRLFHKHGHPVAAEI